MASSQSFFSPQAATSPSFIKDLGPDDTYYGTLTLKDSENKTVPVSIIKSDNSIYAYSSEGKSLGSIFFERPKGIFWGEYEKYYVIRSFTNHTHNKQDMPKVQGIGSLLMECVAAQCLKYALGLKVQASSSHLAYHKLGFTAEGKIGTQSIHSILSKCAEEKLSTSEDIYGVIPMSLLKEGQNVWKQRILCSSLSHDPKLIQKLQDEVLEEISTFSPKVKETIGLFLL